MSTPDLVDGIEVTATGSFRLHYTDEASVRRGFARLARASGWFEVQEELVVPGWGGRIDLFLRADRASAPYVLEFKVDLTLPANIRRAFQQVDGYSRWWTAEHGEESIPILVACKQDGPALSRIADVYPQVTYWGVGALINRIVAGGLRPDDASCHRARIAMQRVHLLEQELRVHRAALAAVERVAASRAEVNS